MEIVAGLAQRATIDPGQPIPVVVNLASWAAHRGPLDDWLVEALAVAYQVHPTLGARLVRADRLLPLLDGLDEVPDRDRAACVRAINTYQQTRARYGGRFRPLVVCSRRVEAEALAARLTRLRLAGAVTLQPLSPEEAVGYLVGVGASEVLEVLPVQPQDDPELWALVRSPLTLDIIALAQTRAAAALRQPADQRLEALLDAYVDTMLTAPKSGGRLRPALAAWPSEQTRGWLAWLAASMTHHAQVEFYLERLQPTWLPTHRARRVVQRSPGLVMGLFGGLLVGLTASPQIRPVETLRWSWFEGLIGGLGGMLFGALVMGLISGLIVGVVGGIVVGRGMGLIIGVITALGRGLVPGTLEATTRPNQGIHRSIRYSGVGGLVLGLAGGLIGWLVSRLLIIGQLMGLVGWVSGGLLRGGLPTIQHYTLRLLLVRMRAIPRPYVRFLNAACDSLLLRRVGGGYRFPHRLLQDRFATYPLAAPVALEHRDAPPLPT